MANRFVRTVRGIKKINKQPLHTNEQNDLLSDESGEVYVRTINKYARITGLSKVEKQVNSLIEQVEVLQPDNDKANEQIQNIKNKQENLKDELNDLKTTTKGNNESLISDIDNLKDKVKDIKSDIENLKSEDLKDTQAREDIEDLQQQIDDIDLTDVKDTRAREDIDNIQQQLNDVEQDIKDRPIHKVLFDGDVSGVDSKIKLSDDIDNYDSIVISGYMPSGRFDEIFLMNNHVDHKFVFNSFNLTDTKGELKAFYEMSIDRNNSKELFIYHDVYYDFSTDTNSDDNVERWNVLRIEGWKS